MGESERLPSPKRNVICYSPCQRHLLIIFTLWKWRGGGLQVRAFEETKRIRGGNSGDKCLFLSFEVK